MRMRIRRKLVTDIECGISSDAGNSQHESDFAGGGVSEELDRSNFKQYNIGSSPPHSDAESPAPYGGYGSDYGCWRRFSESLAYGGHHGSDFGQSWKEYFHFSLWPLAYFLLAFVSLYLSHPAASQGTRLAIIWPANSVGIMCIIRTKNWKTGIIALACFMGTYFCAASAVIHILKLVRPVQVTLGASIGHTSEIAISGVCLRKYKLSIYTAGLNFTVRDLRGIALFAGLVGPLISSIATVTTYITVDPFEQTIGEDFLQGMLLWVLRHASSNVLFIWSLTLLGSRLKYFTKKLLDPRNWGISPFQALAFIFCLACIGITSFFAAYEAIDSLYLLLGLIICWMAYSYNQPVNAAVQLFSFVFIVYCKYNWNYKEGYRSNAELNLIVYSLMIMSCYVSAAQSESRSMVLHIQSLLLEMKTRYAELKQSKDDLEVVSKQSLLFAFMSHEFKTPLSIMIGFCEELGHLKLEKQALDSLHHITHMAEDLLQLTTEMLDMARIRAGKSTLNLQPTDLHRTFTAAAAKLSVYGRASGVGVVSHIAPGVPRMVMTDRLRLDEILHNISANAIKFSSERVSQMGDIEEQLKPQCKMDLGLLDEETWRSLHNEGTMVISPAFKGDLSATKMLMLRVTDTGRGIPASMHKAIFNVYERVGTSTEQTSVPGTGLGLAIVKELVTKMGGGIHLISQVDVGSSFTVLLEAKECRQEKEDPAALKPENVTLTLTAPQKEPPPTVASSFHILVVEDTPLNQKLIGSILNRQGHTFEVAGNGQIALELLLANDQLRRRPYDALILDLFMPIMGGEEFLKQAPLQLPPHLAETPVIVVSADIAPDVRERLLLVNCVSAIMEKPYRPATIKTVLEAAVQKAITCPPTVSPSKNNSLHEFKS